MFPKPKYYYNLGVTLQTAGNHTGAIEAYFNATQGEPDFVDAWYNLGVALQDNGELGGAAGGGGPVVMP